MTAIKNINKTNEKKLRVGIAGYGIVGKRRRKFIDQHPNLLTVAISDIKYKNNDILIDGVRCYKDYKKLINQEIDILFVCLPNKHAPAATILGINHDIHVFCEKPPGKTVEDIKNVIKAEKLHPNVKLKYGFNHRYHDSISDAKKIIESKKFGSILNFRGVYGKSMIIPFTGEWRSRRSDAGGGILLDQGIHMLDMLLFFSSKFVKVYSFISNNYWKHNVEDNAYIMMQDMKGRVAMLHSSATEWEHKFRLEITLEKALIELSGILSSSKSYGEEKLTIIEKNNHKTKKTKAIIRKYKVDNSWKKEINEFYDIIKKNKKIVNGNSQDALNVMKLIYKIYKSDKVWKNKFKIN